MNLISLVLTLFVFINGEQQPLTTIHFIINNFQLWDEDFIL